ncbi:unnamed protein product [Amaranthus hypochondriacus]
MTNIASPKFGQVILISFIILQLLETKENMESEPPKDDHLENDKNNDDNNNNADNNNNPESTPTNNDEKKKEGNKSVIKRFQERVYKLFGKKPAT